MVAHPDLSFSRARPRGFYAAVFSLKAIFHRIRRAPDAKAIVLSQYVFDMAAAQRELHLMTARLGAHSKVQVCEDTDLIVVSHLWFRHYVLIFVSERSLDYLHYRKSRSICGFFFRCLCFLNCLRVLPQRIFRR